MNNLCICWSSRIFLLGILIFKGLSARRLYKLFVVKGLMRLVYKSVEAVSALRRSLTKALNRQNHATYGKSISKNLKEVQFLRTNSFHKFLKDHHEH
jgi:hypothetical protein